MGTSVGYYILDFPYQYFTNNKSELNVLDNIYTVLLPMDFYN